MRIRRLVSPELASGQMIIVVARWLLVLTGLLVTLWNPDPLPRLRVEIGVILLVAIANFVMHAQLLRRRQTLELVAAAASFGDLLVISSLIGLQGGFNSNVFVFYFPALLAIAVAFPTAEAFALGAVGICLGLSAFGVGAPDTTPVLLRGIAMAGVLVMGNAYWRLHRDRLNRVAQRTEGAADVFWGQIATLWARWALLAGGALLVLSHADSTSQLAIGILPVVALLLLNFYLHGRYLVDQPANAVLTLLASCFDVAMLALLCLTSGFGNPMFVFLYPIVFGVGLVYPPRMSWAFTLAAMALYSLLLVSSGDFDAKLLVVRLVTLAAVGGLGSVYWRSVRRDTRKVEPDAAAALAWSAAGAS